jgi:hypothetical protein
MTEVTLNQRVLNILNAQDKDEEDLRGMRIIKCVICGRDFRSTPYPNRSEVCRYCRKLGRRMLDKGISPDEIAIKMLEYRKAQVEKQKVDNERIIKQATLANRKQYTLSGGAILTVSKVNESRRMRGKKR